MATYSQRRVFFCLVMSAVVSHLALVEAQVFSLSQCPAVNAVSNFQVSRYAGKWFENRKYFALFELGLRCVTAEYTVNAAGNVDVRNVGRRVITGTQSVVTGTARQLEAGTGKLGVTFPSIPFAPTDSPYTVLGTDYTNYAVVWSCVNRGAFSTRIAWILTRAQSPSASVIDTALEVLRQNNINLGPLSLTNQSNC